VDEGRSLQGRTAIVTGGASGIGAATVRHLAAAGARVLVLDVQELPPATAADLGEAVDGVLCDVSDEAAVVGSVEAAVGRWGRIDVLVNIAGIEQTTTYDQTTVAEWDRILDVNLRGTFLLCREVAPHMVAAGRGSIVNLASTNGLVGSLAGVAYGASKGGVVILTKDLAIELARTGVRVNAVCPGTIDTPLIRRFLDGSDDPQAAARMLARSMPIGRMGTADEVAQVILFLAGDASSLCTGVALPVDGGLTAR
jgi:NAD(P)-dependent dehydrogenase (short-subunit alcohol dehydrogenase family)